MLHKLNWMLPPIALALWAGCYWFYFYNRGLKSWLQRRRKRKDQA